MSSVEAPDTNLITPFSVDRCLLYLKATSDTRRPHSGRQFPGFADSSIIIDASGGHLKWVLHRYRLRARLPSGTYLSKETTSRTHQWYNTHLGDCQNTICDPLDIGLT